MSIKHSFSLLLILCSAALHAQRQSYGATLAYGVHSQILNKSSGEFALMGEYTFGGYVHLDGKGLIDLQASLQYGTSTFRREVTANTWWVQQQDQLRMMVLAELRLGSKNHLCVGLAPRLGFRMQGTLEQRIGGVFAKFSYRRPLESDEYNPQVQGFQVAPVIGWKYTPVERLHFFLYAEQDLLPLLKDEVSISGTYGLFTLFQPIRFNPTIFRAMLALQFDIGKP